MKLTIDGKSYEVELQPDAVVVGGTPFKVVVLRDGGEATVKVAGRPYKVKLKDEQTVLVDGREYKIAMSGRAAIARQTAKAVRGPARAAERGAVRALMPGKVLSLRVAEGQQVSAGTVLLILEAMKMENEIRAPIDGTVKRIAVGAGQTVNNGDVMVVVE